ncbi:hypothetical protein AMS68_006926 [Peltaster fructicola]|uniref:Mediator of RNA polymerase II transcription subunit 7 n=1 Tax=Peltaster fructicola TaxID=286661 RepID=A0A6H0Y3I4_9PEZI|nr:hypothetical protein AMS68_006926 [Peltaster fructicola]
MGDKQQATTFPTPPPFYKHFTSTNLHRSQQQKQQQSIEAPEPPAAIDVPAELRYLVPPQPPADGRWKTFGYQHDLNAPDPTLDEAGIDTLYPDHPSIKLAPQVYLIALARSLLATFLSTCGILAQNPALHEEKVKNLRDMVFNMHDLINQYRPHQARESLLLMMEERVEQLRQEIKTIGELKGKIHKALNEVNQATDGPLRSQDQAESIDKAAASLDGRKAEQELAWRLLDDLADEVHIDNNQPLTEGD